MGTGRGVQEGQEREVLGLYEASALSEEVASCTGFFVALWPHTRRRMRLYSKQKR